MPPRNAEQSYPESFNKCAINDDVVVLPCVPATAIVNEPSEIIPKTCERLRKIKS